MSAYYFAEQLSCFETIDKENAMSQEDVEKLLGRLLTDDQLRQKAPTQLSGICQELGSCITADELKRIKPEDIVRMSMVSSWLDTGIKRTFIFPPK